jgi:hypothetical protein
MRSHDAAHATDEWVALTHAPHGPLADLICNILTEEGIDSYSRRALAFDVPDFLASGPRVVMVRQSQHAQATALIASLPIDDEDVLPPNAR